MKIKTEQNLSEASSAYGSEPLSEIPARWYIRGRGAHPKTGGRGLKGRGAGKKSNQKFATKSEAEKYDGEVIRAIFCLYEGTIDISHRIPINQTHLRHDIATAET